MKVRAIAIATERSNAVGTVELECTPHGLVVVYLDVGTFAEGYTPGAMTDGARLVVAWSRVRQARVEGEQVYLEFDAAVSPHNRLTLVNLSTGEAVHHREVYRQRLLLRITASAAAVVSLAVAALTLPRVAPRVGAAAALCVGALAAAAVLAIGLWAERRVAVGGADSDAAREAFAAELSLFLPSLIRRPEAPRKPPKLPTVPSIQGILPRTTLAVVITLTAGLLAILLMGRWVVSADRRPRRVANRPPVHDLEPTEPPELVSEPAPGTIPARRTEPAPPAPVPADSAAPTPVAASAPAPADVGQPCRCFRSDSVLWAEPIPRLSMLTLAERKRRVGEHSELEVDVAAVNNGDQEIRDLTLVLNFFEQDPPPSSKRYSVAARSVFFEGPLVPGQAIKWTVEARGEEFEFAENPIAGDVGPNGEHAAPANFLADLLHANHRPVRLHGAMMLAFLGDPRAREGALTLREALREDEAAYLQRVIVATSDVRSCRLEVTPEAGGRYAVRACVFNASAETKSNLALRVRGLDTRVTHQKPVAPPPTVNGEATLPVPIELGPQQGVMVAGTTPLTGATARPIAMFEALAGRIDLLR